MSLSLSTAGYTLVARFYRILRRKTCGPVKKGNLKEEEEEEHTLKPCRQRYGGSSRNSPPTCAIGSSRNSPLPPTCALRSSRNSPSPPTHARVRGGVGRSGVPVAISSGA